MQSEKIIVHKKIIFILTDGDAAGSDAPIELKKEASRKNIDVFVIAVDRIDHSELINQSGKKVIKIELISVLPFQIKKTVIASLKNHINYKTLKPKFDILEANIFLTSIKTIIERFTTSFIKSVGMEDKFQLNNFIAGKGYHYGSCLPVIALWQQLNLTDIINQALPEKVTIAVAQISLIQTANRFADPGSKLACYRWHDHSLFSQLKHFVNVPDAEPDKLHTYYHSLDYLCSIKADIEQQLYYHFNSYHHDHRLILYDSTSVYFEGEQAEVAVPGYSRDHRPDADQIVVGVVINGEGIPIAHHIFEGNTVDKTTVTNVIADLEKRFSITNVIFVGDRGLLTSSNIEVVKSHGCQYIMGLQRRNRRIINYLLETVAFTTPELASTGIIMKEASYADLAKPLQQDYDEKVRFIICYHKQMAEQKKQRRDKNLTKFAAFVNQTQHTGSLHQIKESHHKMQSFLSKYKMSQFYRIDIENRSSATEERYQLKLTPNDEVLRLEQRLDGKFFIQTEVGCDQLDTQQVVNSYKSLQKVARAFRVIKDELDIRPV